MVAVPVKATGGITLFIHKYVNDNVSGTNYCISTSKEECLIDEDEAEKKGMSTKAYQEHLKLFGAKIHKHVFHYGDGSKKEVEDSYFSNLEDAVKCAMAF